MFECLFTCYVVYDTFKAVTESWKSWTFWSGLCSRPLERAPLANRFKDLGFQVAEKLEKEIDTYYPIYQRIDPHHVAANLDLKRGWTGTPSLECMISCELIVFARPASFRKALCRVLDNVNVNVSNPKRRLCYKGLLRGMICASETEI